MAIPTACKTSSLAVHRQHETTIQTMAAYNMHRTTAKVAARSALTMVMECPPGFRSCPAPFSPCILAL